MMKQIPVTLVAVMAIVLLVCTYEFLVASEEVANYFIRHRRMYFGFAMIEALIFMVKASKTKMRMRYSFWLNLAYMLGLIGLFIYPYDLTNEPILVFWVGLFFISRWISIR